jgi:hypothetical protein
MAGCLARWEHQCSQSRPGAPVVLSVWQLLREPAGAGAECGGRGGEPRECGEAYRGGRAEGLERVRAAGAIRSVGGRVLGDGC